MRGRGRVKGSEVTEPRLDGSARWGAPQVTAIRNVTALVGPDLVPQHCDIEITGNRITGIVAHGDSPGPAGSGAKPARNMSTPPGATEIDGKGLLAMPGMVDTHDHLRMLAPGLPIAEGLALDDFLRVMWATQAHMGATEYEVAALLGGVQRLKCGVTTVIDHAYTFHAPGLDQACLRGFNASGARWAYARGIMTRPYEPVCETFDQAADNIRALVETATTSSSAGVTPQAGNPQDGRPDAAHATAGALQNPGPGKGPRDSTITHTVTPDRLFVAPVSLRQASPDDYRRAAELAAELDCGLYTHLAETPAELRDWREQTGHSPVEALHHIGFLNERTVLAHCVRVTPDETDLLARTGTSVAHCPSNNMKLAKGVTPVPAMLRAGVNVCLGIDMMSDMHSEMRAELGMQCLHLADPQALSPLDVLQMATWRGARAAGLAPGPAPATDPAADTQGDTSRAGTLAVGATADITLCQADSLFQAPLVEFHHALVYHTYAPMVRHVMVDGRLVVQHGASTLVDEQALMHEAMAVSKAWRARLDTPEPSDPASHARPLSPDANQPRTVSVL